jgi:peptidylprolyl isomerase
VRFRDARVGDGPEGFAHDAVVILFTARVLPSDDGALDRRRAGDTFDPFVVGGAGASASKGFKLEIGSATNDIPEGWARAFEGDGDAMPRMRIGGKRIVRIPPSLAYGERGHHCRDGVRGACEVNPGESVEIDFEILRYT